MQVCLMLLLAFFKVRMRVPSCVHWAIQQWYVRYLPDAPYSTPISWQGMVPALTELIWEVLTSAIGQLVITQNWTQLIELV